MPGIGAHSLRWGAQVLPGRKVPLASLVWLPLHRLAPAGPWRRQPCLGAFALAVPLLGMPLLRNHVTDASLP